MTTQKQKRSTKIINNKIDSLNNFVDEDQFVDDRDMTSTNNKKMFRAEHVKVHVAVHNYIKKWWRNQESNNSEIMDVLYNYTTTVVDVASILDYNQSEKFEDWKHQVLESYRQQLT